MKIQGPNLAKLTAYHTQLQQQTGLKKTVKREDQLDISSEAKHLQETKLKNKQRAEYVQEIKNAVKSGAYKVDNEKVAQKMIDFWSNHS